MAVAMRTACAGTRACPTLPARSPRSVRIVCSANKEEQGTSVVAKLAVPVATVVTAASLLTAAAAFPEQAVAARSGGRVGSSAGFARRAAAPRAAAPRTSTTTRAGTTINNVYVAPPPLYSPFSPFGGFGFGFGGFRIMPVVPIPFFGGLLQFMFFALIAGVVLNTVRGFLAAASEGSKKKDKDWDEL